MKIKCKRKIGKEKKRFLFNDVNQRKCYFLPACMCGGFWCVCENYESVLVAKKNLNHTVPCRFHSVLFLSSASCSLNRKTSPVKSYTILLSLVHVSGGFGCVGEG